MLAGPGSMARLLPAYRPCPASMLLLCPLLLVVPLCIVFGLTLLNSVFRGKLEDPKTLAGDLAVINDAYDYNAHFPQNDFALGDVMRYFKATTDLDYWLLERFVGPGMHTVLTPRTPWVKSNARQCVFVMIHIRGSAASVLEVGCGRGFCTLNLAELFPDAKFLGVDAVDRHVEVARKAAADAGIKNAEFREQDMLSEPNGKYGVIFGVESLCYMDTPKKRMRFMQNAAEMLESWGCVVIVDGFRSASFDTKSAELQVATCLAERGFRIKRLASKDDWIIAARSAGLRLVRDLDLTEEAIPFWTKGWRVARTVLQAFPYFARWLVAHRPETAANLLAVATTAFALRGGAAEYGVLVFKR